MMKRGIILEILSYAQPMMSPNIKYPLNPNIIYESSHEFYNVHEARLETIQVY